MSSVEERLAKIERELEELKKKQFLTDNKKSHWLLPPSTKFKDDEELKEIFRLGKELRDKERSEEAR